MADQDQDENQQKATGDPLREPPIRYLGYANEVGEAFRSLVHVNIVRASYGVATSYVIADGIHKGSVAASKDWSSDELRRSKVMWAVADTMIWQGLASVIIPGFTINRACAAFTYGLRRLTNFPEPVRKWTVTGLGLALIPFIIEPIDRSVDRLMESTLRQYYGYEGPVMKEIVKHRRSD